MSLASVILADSPVVFLALDETSGTNFNNQGSYTTDGTLTGTGVTLPGTVSIPTVGDTGVNFTGNSGTVITVPYNVALDSASFTVEAWLETTQTSNRQIVDRDGSGGPRRWQMRMNSLGQLQVLLFSNNTGTNQSVTGSATINDGAVHHVAVRRTPTDIYLYVDGVLDISAANSYTQAGNSVLTVGRLSSTTEPMIGGIAYVAYWSSDIGATRIAAHYAAGTSTTSLTAETGVITVTGVAASIPLIAGSGVITLNGVDASLALVAGTGHITITGVDAALHPVLIAGTGVITVTGVAASILIVGPWPTSGAAGRVAVLTDPNRTYVSTGDMVLTVLVNSTGNFTLTLLDQFLAPIDLTGCTVTWDVMQSGIPVIADLACAVLGSPTAGTVTVPTYASPLEDGVYSARATLTDGSFAYPYPARGIEVRG